MKEFFGRKDEVQLSDLKNKFYSAPATLRSALYKAVVEEGYSARARTPSARSSAAWAVRSWRSAWSGASSCRRC